MSKRNYTHIKELVPTIQVMVAEGKTQREIAEQFGFRDRLASADTAGRLTDRLINNGCANTIGMIVSCPICINTEASCLSGCIDIGAQKDKRPTVLFLLPLNHGFEPFVGVLAAGILHTVSSNHKQGLLGAILLTGMLMDISNMMDGTANRIQ